MLKRLFDIVLSFVLLLCLSPIIAVIALVIWAVSGRPIFFVQNRPGIDGVEFSLVKFRTMSVENITDKNHVSTSDSVRLTTLGCVLRSTSLDELPTIWNVFAGDMSFVGPRPLLNAYLSRYSKEQARRHDVKPGITGWAQVNGRNAISWEEKFEYDVWYVDNRSFLLDLKILCMTASKVFRREGISQKGHDTAEEFKGSSLPGSGEGHE